DGRGPSALLDELRWAAAGQDPPIDGAVRPRSVAALPVAVSRGKGPRPPSVCWAHRRGRPPTHTSQARARSLDVSPDRGRDLSADTTEGASGSCPSKNPEAAHAAGIHFHPFGPESQPTSGAATSTFRGQRLARRRSAQ